MEQVSRRRFLQGIGIAGVAGLAGCVGSDGDPDGGDGGSGAGSDGGSGGSQSPASQASGTTTDPGEVDLPVADEALTVQYATDRLTDETRSGGPPKDGIPSIDDPSFTDVEGGDQQLDPGDIVFGYAGAEDVKAYPQRILVQHEITNDELDGRPVTVSYCPLTATAMGFERGEVEFGVSGNLLNNNLVMYDRATDSRWPQILGTAIKGPLAGRSLQEFRLVWTTWDQWKSQYPETKVLSEDTGFARSYGRDPYGRYNPKGGYYVAGRTLFPNLNENDRFHEKDHVIGVRTPAGAAAFYKNSLRDAGVLEGGLDGDPLVAVYDERLDTGYVYRNPDELSVSLDGATATVGGEQTAPDELPLERVYAFDAMWFAWTGFYPDSEVFE